MFNTKVQWIARHIDCLNVFLLWSGAQCLYTLTLAPTLSWRNGGVDGGDLITAAALGGVPHPSGYPTYLILARLFLLLPIGDEAYRLNWMSAVWASGAIVCFYWLARQNIAPTTTWLGSLSVIGASAVLATTPLLWALATIAEVHTLHVFGICLLLGLLWSWRERQSVGRALGIGLILGWGLGNHLIYVLVIPTLGVLLFSAASQPKTHTMLKLWLWIILGWVLGLVVYAYLPIASQISGYTPWGRIDSFETFGAYISGELYRHYFFALPLSEWPRRMWVLGQMLLLEFQGWGLVLAVLGMVRQWQVDKYGALALSSLTFSNILFAVGYNTTDSFQYLLATWLVMSVWLSIGLRQALDYVLVQVGQTAVVLCLLSVCVVIGMLTMRRCSSLDLSHDRTAEQYAYQMLEHLPPNSVLISGTDAHTFALWYFVQVRRVRTDVMIVDQDLFNHVPYRAYLNTQGFTFDLSVQTSLETWIREHWAARSILLTDAPADNRYRLQPQGQLQRVIGVSENAPIR